MCTLMTNVYWVLGKKSHASSDDFVAAVTDYNKKIDPVNSKWNPTQAVAFGSITVVFEALWKDEDAKVNLEIGEPNQVLTMGSVLFTLNNATVDFFKDADHCFFEGLVPCPD
ncbi:MAG: hypothetical protein HYX68_03920 [Planctomycetes bacterium]|nr:hypothetical protein [Planctomycetota bacterium]